MIKSNTFSVGNLTKFFFLNLFLLPIYPDNLKPSCIVLFFVFTIYSVITKKKHNKKRPKKYVYLLLINISVFVVLLLSILYSSNIAIGLEYLFRLLPVLLFPISFFLLKSNQNIFSKTLFTKAKLLFFSSTLLLFIVVFFVFYFRGFVTENYFLNYSYRIIFQLGKYSMHPIYASLITSIALIFSVSLYQQHKYKLLIILGDVILLINLILLSRKSAIIIMGLLFLVFLFFKLKTSLKVKLISVSLLICSFILICKFIPDISNRFTELNSVFDEHKISSTNLRVNISKLTIKVISKEPLLGYGVGDTKDILTDLQKKNTFFKGNYYNTHNQFLGFTLASGFIGLVFFIVFLLTNLKLVFNKSFEQLAILMLFISLMFIENILDRQNGVIYFALIINYFSFYNLINSSE